MLRRDAPANNRRRSHRSLSVAGRRGLQGSPSRPTFGLVSAFGLM